MNLIIVYLPTDYKTKLEEIPSFRDQYFSIL